MKFNLYWEKKDKCKDDLHESFGFVAQWAKYVDWEKNAEGKLTSKTLAWWIISFNVCVDYVRHCMVD